MLATGPGIGSGDVPLRTPTFSAIRTGSKTKVFAATDPTEQIPLPVDHPLTPQAIRLLDRVGTKRPTPGRPQELTDDDREALRSLGYIE